MNSLEATDRLVTQYTRDEYLIPLFVAFGIPRIDAVAGVTSLVATTFFQDAQKRGQEAQGLSDWHTDLRQRCSEKFYELKNTNPGLTKREVNAIDELLVLNGVRRGVKHAMGQSYYYASRHHMPVGWAAMRREFLEDNVSAER
jgi:hypothetical protein